MEKQVIIITTESQLEETFQKVAEKVWGQKEPQKDYDSDRLTRREASKFLGCSYQTIYNYLKQGLLREHGIQKKKFFLRSELIEFITNNDKKTINQ
ncbi:MAG: helix-turn-helix domain-containing protein [Bacteroidales bacterium]|nr:helix-turn-helix domain-containing protein [Bacteroidales bacterium]